MKNKILAFWVSITLILPMTLLAQKTEYEIKAAYLERFTRFIDWPNESNVEDTTRSFILTVIGKTQFVDILKRDYRIQKIRNKKVELRFISNPGEIQDCHLLYIAKSEKNNISKILSVTNSKPILTISDCKGCAEKGILINLYMDDNRIRFEINESAARESQLYISYLLYNNARIVNPIGGKNENYSKPIPKK